MRIPILKLNDCLLVSIQWELDDQTALHFQEDLLHKIHETSANGYITRLRMEYAKELMEGNGFQYFRNLLFNRPQ